MISVRKLLMKLTFVFLTILILSSQISCTDRQPKQVTPKMTASEVCQYINQALPITYESIGTFSPISFRYEVHYIAKDASYLTSNIAWLVNVQVVKKPQRLGNNVWADTSTLNLKIISSTQQYYYYESSGAVVKK